MSNSLENFSNIWADLAESSYVDSAKSFAHERLSSKSLKALESEKSVKFDFSESTTYKGKFIPGGQAPDVNDKLYLQPA